MSDYLPCKDADYDGWLTNFHTYVMAHLDHFRLLPADTDPLDTTFQAWQLSFSQYTAAKTALDSICETKKTDRKSSEAVVRKLVSMIQSCPATTNADREALKITVPSAPVESGAVLEPSDDKPLATVDISNRLKHTFKIQNQTLSGVKNGKPAGAMGAEIWVKIGEPPTGPSDTQLVGIATRTTFVLEFSDDKAGKQAYYMMRWITSKGEAGSWSETLSATIAA